MSTFKTPKGSILPILNLRGKDYLQVQHRLVWFTEERPAWSIHTVIIDRGPTHCLMQAEICDERQQVRATAHKYEDKEGFADFIEKAETGAIGRALALLGFGTQFCADDLDEGTRLADAPAPRVSPAPPKRVGGAPSASNAKLREPAPPITTPITPVVVKPAVSPALKTEVHERRMALIDAAKKSGWSPTDVSVQIQNRFGKHLVPELTNDEYQEILAAVSRPKPLDPGDFNYGANVQGEEP